MRLSDQSTAYDEAVNASGAAPADSPPRFLPVTESPYEAAAPPAPPTAAADQRAPGDGPGLLLFQAAAILLALFFLATAGTNPDWPVLSRGFTGIVLEALPFVLLGALVSGFIEVFVPRERITALLPARASYTVLLAGLLGVVFPVCECAVIPVVRRLMRKGVPLSAAIAYLLAGPIVNPIVASSTAVAYAFHPEVAKIVAIRMMAGYAIAVAVGALLGELFSPRRALLPGAVEDTPVDGCGCHTCPADQPPRRGFFGRIFTALTAAADDFVEIGRFLILGAFFAGVAQSFIDYRHMTVLTSTPSLSIGLMMALAVGLNLCSEADAFVAASFQNTLPLSAQMAFMVLGPMLDIKLLLMYTALFRRRMIFALATLVLVLVFASMRAFAYFSAGAA